MFVKQRPMELSLRTPVAGLKDYHVVRMPLKAWDHDQRRLIFY